MGGDFKEEHKYQREEKFEKEEEKFKEEEKIGEGSPSRVEGGGETTGRTNHQPASGFSKTDNQAKPVGRVMMMFSCDSSLASQKATRSISTYRLHQNQQEQNMMMMRRAMMMIMMMMSLRLHQKKLYGKIRMADPESV